MASTATYSLDNQGTAFGNPGSTYIQHKIAVVCDATPSAVADCAIPVDNTYAGEIVAIAVVQPASAFPDSATVTVKDQRGITVATGTVTGGASLKTRLELSDGLNYGRCPFIGPLTVSHSGNTTASATWDTYITVY